ncbi:Nif3-like dinuclear metal center hexameric protein [Fictibacillus fluitans]|uniref:GTP cyclohydrolase 1 type 2 homolog n=1 Tax=Fictibacillus fluitans TaxID=3058422 RepID=A0ABT8HW73_9BACL|nr:Nif3-like dinuclear metal center hexameric protein [Fictibacillus sp. NE201]MDN4525027.1 Nif3-like dinuclear metal center hexameric protein [Fictibacillus sp. NE201]
MMPTIQEVMNALIKPVGEVPETVDTLKTGNPEERVKGIAVSFMPTHSVIEKAAGLGANLLITHEPLFYNHRDDPAGLGDDPVYLQKAQMIKDAGISVFRFHDYWHRYKPDGIMAGLLQALDWQDIVEEHRTAATFVNLPGMTVAEVAAHVKQSLGISFVRVTGNESAICQRAALLAGYRGGGAHCLPLFNEENVDLILYGEGPEWETPEYVRDAVYQGKQKALLVLGHAESEEPGMRHLAGQIRKLFPEVPVHFVEEKPVFRLL